MARQHRGPIETVKHAVAANRSIWVLCLECGHAQLYDPWVLAQKVDDAKLADLGSSRRMQCRRCGAKGKAHLVPSTLQRLR